MPVHCTNKLAGEMFLQTGKEQYGKELELLVYRLSSPDSHKMLTVQTQHLLYFTHDTKKDPVLAPKILKKVEISSRIIFLLSSLYILFLCRESFHIP